MTLYLVMSPVSRTFVLIQLAIISVVLTVYLIGAHYVKAYSDPVGFLFLAEAMQEGHPVTSRAFVYPAFLVMALQLLGPIYIFLSNLLFILLLVYLIYIVSTQLAVGSNHNETFASDKKGLVGLFAVCMFIIANRRFLVEILNPFREPLAFSLLVGSMALLLAYDSNRGLLKGVFAGMLVGLAISTRETCMLILPSIGLWWLCCYIRDKSHAWLRVIPIIVIGLMIGLIPFFVQNYMHSGNVAVPSYAAGKFEDITSKNWDIPVLGMSLRHFSSTGRQSLIFLYEKYRWIGWFLFGIGVIRSMCRKSWPVLLLFLSAAFLHLLFYCFYWYMKERYLFVVELFVVPLMAIGFVTLLEIICNWGPRFFKQSFPWICKGFAMGFIVLLGITLSEAYQSRRGNALKVWNIKTFQSHAIPTLKAPYTFLGSRHFNHLFTWLLRGESNELIRSFDKEKVKEVGLDKALELFGASAIDYIGKGNYYIYGDHSPPLFQNWFDIREVLSLQDIPVPIDHYGKPLDKGLYKVETWKNTSINKNIEIPVDADAYLLKLDAYRLWDYPSRSYCNLSINGRLVKRSITNGLQFMNVPVDFVKQHSTINVQITSDGPLPERPVLEIIPINAEMQIPLGALGEVWYYPYLSPELVYPIPLKDDSCLLFKKGTIQLPLFADTNYQVFASFRVELFQRDSYFQKAKHTLIVQASDHRSSIPLPGQQQATVVVDMGRGCERLGFVDVRLTSTLPGLEDQTALMKQGQIEEWEFIKLFDVRLFAVPIELKSSLSIDIGGQDDGRFLSEGFYPREKYLDQGSIRWTMPHAKIGLPLATSDQGLNVRIRARKARPDPFKANPVFRVNGLSILPENVSMQIDSNNVIEYSFLMKNELDHLSKKTVIEINSEGWNPKKTIGLPDSRDLGLMIDHVEVELAGE